MLVAMDGLREGGRKKEGRVAATIARKAADCTEWIGGRTREPRTEDASLWGSGGRRERERERQ